MRPTPSCPNPCRQRTLSPKQLIEKALSQSPEYCASVLLYQKGLLSTADFRHIRGKIITNLLEE